MIAGTLAYMAPEQIGRMNRSVDSRSDLYSVGAAFYEMLTGRLSFVECVDAARASFSRTLLRGPYLLRVKFGPHGFGAVRGRHECTLPVARCRRRPTRISPEMSAHL